VERYPSENFLQVVSQVSFGCANRFESAVGDVWTAGTLIGTNRLNTKLESKDLEPMTDLVKDFSNGVKLIEVRGDCITSMRRRTR
jgi:hypothetical protein